MSHLLREHAPITEESWARIDEEARERLTPALAARKLVDFAGPLGWQHSATNLGRIAALDAPFDGVTAAQRRVLPLVELRAPFDVLRAELADSDRGAEDTDFDDARRGRARSSPRPRTPRCSTASRQRASSASQRPRRTTAIPLGKRLQPLPAARRQGGRAPARGRHRRALRHGARAGAHTSSCSRAPRTAAGSCSTTCARSSADRSCGRPGVEGAVVLSMRGGDFLFESGEDISVGYESHGGDAVTLYLEESFSFRVATPEAAVALTP